MREIRTTQTFKLRIEVGEIASLKQRIVAEVHAGHDVLSTECDLFGLGKEIVDATIEHETSDFFYWNLFFGDKLRGVQNVERKFLGKSIIEELQAKLPLRKIAGLNGSPQITPMEVRIGAVDLHRFIPDYRLHAEFGLPMKFYEGRFAAGVDQPEGMYSEALHKSERPGNRTV